MRELLIIGFADKHRALEVLPQLQRLHFDWSVDLQNAVAVEVEKDGSLRIFLGMMLGAGADGDDYIQWKALLGAILPQAPRLRTRSRAQEVEADAVGLQTGRWLDEFSFDQDFLRNATALLRPGSSALLAIVRDGQNALAVMSGYSHFVLHTSIT